MTAILTILCLALLCVIAYLVWQKRKTEQRIRELAEYLTLVQDQNYVPAISDAEEGIMGTLASEIYKVSSALHRQYLSEQKTNRFLRDLLADVSHQIKTPLAAVTLLSDHLKSENLTQRERMKDIRAIQKQTDHASRLIRDLLISAEIEAGVLPFRKETVFLQACINSVFETLAVSAELKGVELYSSIPPQVSIEGDAHWLSEAFANIVKNCIEHTPAGGSVSLKCTDTNLSAEVTVADTGEGIDPDVLPHVFERFYKSSDSYDSNGIGLYLAKQIILMHNGLIEVSSTVGKGTVFTVRFRHTATV